MRLLNVSQNQFTKEELSKLRELDKTEFYKVCYGGNPEKARGLLKPQVLRRTHECTTGSS